MLTKQPCCAWARALVGLVLGWGLGLLGSWSVLGVVWVFGVSVLGYGTDWLTFQIKCF